MNNYWKIIQIGSNSEEYGVGGGGGGTGKLRPIIVLNNTQYVVWLLSLLILYKSSFLDAT